MVRFALVLGVVLGFSSLARADVAPPDSCTTAGTACANAGTTYDHAGVCTAMTCSRATPNGPMDYACTRCTITTADMTTAATKPSSGSCSAPGGQGAGATALLVLLGALWIRRSRTA